MTRGLDKIIQREIEGHRQTESGKGAIDDSKRNVYETYSRKT